MAPRLRTAILPSPRPSRRAGIEARALLALLVTLVGLAGCAPRAVTHRRAAEQVARGYRHLAAGDAERAEVAFEHALAFDPELPEAENGLGVVARARGDLAAARARFERAVALRPGFAEAHANLGEVRLAAGEREAGLRALEAALAIAPDLAEPRQNLARELIAASREDGVGGDPGAAALRARARRELLHLLEAAPDRAAAHHDLAFLDYGEGRFAEAERGYRRAAALDPGSVEALHGLCISLVRLGRCAEAVDACERCLAVSAAADRCRASLRGARACAGE